LASVLVASVDAVMVPAGIAARPISTPFRYTTKPSSNMTSPIIADTTWGSSIENDLVK
jgi:hypothetical protein